MRHFQRPAAQFQEGDGNDNPKYNSQELDKESGYYYYNVTDTMSGMSAKTGGREQAPPL
jgi:hypothetical protein